MVNRYQNTYIYLPETLSFLDFLIPFLFKYKPLYLAWHASESKEWPGDLDLPYPGSTQTLVLNQVSVQTMYAHNIQNQDTIESH